MSDLEEIARAAPIPGSRPYAFSSRPRSNPLLSGFLLGLGAAPVLLGVLLLHSWIQEKRFEQKVNDATARMREAVERIPNNR